MKKLPIIAATVAKADGFDGVSGVLTVCFSLSEYELSPEFFDDQAEQVVGVLEMLPAETLNRIQVWLASRFVPANAKLIEEIKIDEMADA